MPSNTTYNPTNIGDFQKAKLLFDSHGILRTIPAGTSANLDYILTDDCLITGLELIINNGNYGDTTCLQIIDDTEMVLNQFITNWNVPPIANSQFDIEYPAKIIAGLTIRMIYTSTGSSDVFLAINYKLHKILL
jgi:hypothetical protein